MAAGASIIAAINNLIRTIYFSFGTLAGTTL
jgi:hypothetical protein